MRAVQAIMALLALSFVLSTPASGGEYNGPYVIKDDTVWDNVSYVLNSTVFIEENASLTIVDSTVVPSQPFNGSAMLIGDGPVHIMGSVLEGGRWYTIVSSTADVVIEDTEMTNSSNAVLTGGNLTVSGSVFRDHEYTVRPFGSLFTAVDTLFEECAFAFVAYSDHTDMTNVTFLNTTYFVGYVYSETANLADIRIIGAGDGIAAFGTSISLQVTAENVRASNCAVGSSGPPVSGGVLHLDHAGAYLHDSTISDSDAGVMGSFYTIETVNTTFHGLDGALYGLYIDGNVTDSVFENCTIGMEAARSDIAFIDCTFVGTPIEARQWWQVRVSVEDPYGDDVRSAVVTIEDNVGNVSDGVTNILGQIDFGIVAYVQINGTVSIFGPYEVTVEKDGFVTVESAVEFEDVMDLDVLLEYWKPDLNITKLTVSSGHPVVIRATVVNEGDHGSIHASVDFTYRKGPDVLVIGTVQLGNISVNGVAVARIEWDADEGEYRIEAHAVSGNEEIGGIQDDNHMSRDLTVEDEIEDADPVLVALIIAMLVVIALLILKFVVRMNGSSDGDTRSGPPETWNEVKREGRRSKGGRPPAPKGRAPGRRRPKVRQP